MTKFITLTAAVLALSGSAAPAPVIVADRVEATDAWWCNDTQTTTSYTLEGTAVQIEKVTNTYFSNGRLSKRVTEKQHTDGVVFATTTEIFDENEYLLEMIEMTDREGYKTCYTYNDRGDRTEEIYYYFNQEKKDFVPSYRINSDIQENITSSYSSNYNAATDSWGEPWLFAQSEVERDAQGRCTKFVQRCPVRFDSGTELIDFFAYTYVYEGNSEAPSEMYEKTFMFDTDPVTGSYEQKFQTLSYTGITWDQCAVINGQRPSDIFDLRRVIEFRPLSVAFTDSETGTTEHYTYSYDGTVGSMETKDYIYSINMYSAGDEFFYASVKTIKAGTPLPEGQVFYEGHLNSAYGSINMQASCMPGETDLLVSDYDCLKTDFEDNLPVETRRYILPEDCTVEDFDPVKALREIPGISASALTLSSVTERDGWKEYAKPEGGIGEITADAIDFSAPVEYFTVDGRRVANPTTGLYIVKQGAKVAKHLVR